MKRVVICRRQKDCSICNEELKVGKECIQDDYKFFHKKCGFKWYGEIKVRAKCPYKDKEDFEKNYLEKLDREMTVSLFKSWVGGRKDMIFFEPSFEKIRNLSDSERRENFENAATEELIFDYIRYVLIKNYKDLGWSLTLRELEI